MTTPDSPILTAMARFRAALEAKDAQAMQRLINAYRDLYDKLRDKIDLLTAEIAEQAPTAGQVVRLQRYKDLMAQAAQELQKYQAYTEVELATAGRLGIQLGESNGRALISIAATGDARLAIALNKLPIETIKALLGFLDSDGPLYVRLAKLWPTTVDEISKAIIAGVGLGKNPRAIAAAITDAFGMGLTDSMRMVRTAQIWSYREANRASYVANDDIVQGWQWSAHLDDRVCMSCFAMHGSIHPLDEPLNDHHNGRCAAIPVVFGLPAPIETKGEDIFKSLPEARQKALMGQSKWEAWSGGKFGFDQLSGTHVDDVYGPMRIEASLKELLGELGV